MLIDSINFSTIKEIAQRGVWIRMLDQKNNQRVNSLKTKNKKKPFHEVFLSGGSWHAHKFKASHLFLQTRSPLTRPDIWMCLQLKVSDSPVKTIHLSTGQMLSKVFLHLSGAERAGKKPPGIQLLPIAAFTKHFVSHCHNTNFPCSRTKGAQSLEQLCPAVDILSANPLKDDRPAHHLENTQEGPLRRTAQVLSQFYLSEKHAVQ